MNRRPILAYVLLAADLLVGGAADVVERAPTRARAPVRTWIRRGKYDNKRARKKKRGAW
jgi:hypothetical protein